MGTEQHHNSQYCGNDDNNNNKHDTQSRDGHISFLSVPAVTSTDKVHTLCKEEMLRVPSIVTVQAVKVNLELRSSELISRPL